MMHLSVIRARYEQLLRQLNELNSEAQRVGTAEELKQQKREQDRSEARARLLQFDEEWKSRIVRIEGYEKRARQAGGRVASSGELPSDISETYIELQLERLQSAPSGADKKNIAEYIIALCQGVRQKHDLLRRPLLAKTRTIHLLTEDNDNITLENKYAELLTCKETKELFEECQTMFQKWKGNTFDRRIWAFQELPLPLKKEYYLKHLEWAKDIVRVDVSNDLYCYIVMPQILPRMSYFLCETRRGGEAIANGVLNYLRLRIEHERIETHWSVVIQDTVTLYDSSIGFLQGVSGDCLSSYAAPACHNSDEANQVLEQLWVMANSNPKQRIVVLRGYPGRINSEKVERLVNNADRLKLHIFIIDESGSSEPPMFYRQSKSPIYKECGDAFFSMDDGRLYLRMGSIIPLDSNQIRDINNALKPIIATQDYRYPLPKYPPAMRSLKKDGLRLPFGKDDAGRIGYYDTHDNPKDKGADGNAGFVVGVSGSGKSTLLHTIIASVILNYHPDEVEIWLADFKMKEFARYTRHRPPHVRYILLDESPDMVRSLIDKLTEEMKYRQRKIASVPSAVWYQDVPNLPLLFVIIDEFSRMSQAIRGDSEYKIKLQNLFTQARDQGIRFLLSSQFYAAGVESLNDQAKDQIGIRMAMRTNDKNEMKATLALPTRLSDQQDTMIRLLPNHMILQREGSGLGQYHVFYFTDEDSKRYDALIDQLSERMEAIPGEKHYTSYIKNNPSRKNEIYLDKSSLVVSGDPAQLETFDERRADFTREKRNDLRTHMGQKRLLLWTGRSRRLEASSAMVLHRQDDENILICSNYQSDDEQRSGMQSIIRSIIQSALLQKATPIVLCSPSDMYLTDEWKDPLHSIPILSDPEEILKYAQSIENEVSKGREADKEDVLLIFIDPVSMLGSQTRKALKQQLLFGESDDMQAIKHSASGLAGLDILSGDLENIFEIKEDEEENKKSRPIVRQTQQRTLQQIIPYLIVAGSEQGVHIICVTPRMNQLLRSGLLPDDHRGTDGKLSFLRHRIAFRMLEEDNDDYALHRASRTLLTDNLMNCYVYRDGMNISVREPYRMPLR